MVSSIPREEQLRQDEVVMKGIHMFNEMSNYRATFGGHWEEVAEILAPNMRNTFYRWNINYPGVKKADRQVDASGMVANVKFAAICDAMLTPFSSQWHGLAATNPYVQKDRKVRLWFEQAARILFQLRYQAEANFRKQNNGIFQSIGAFGNGPMFIDQLTDLHGRPVKGFRYKACPVGEVYIKENHQGRVDTFLRTFRLTGRQAAQKFGGPDNLSAPLRVAFDKGTEVSWFNFFHIVYPNDKYEPGRAGWNGKPFYSCYIDETGKKLMQEGGYYSFPMAYARYTQAPDETYGRGPAMDVLPSLKTLNAQKATFLKQGHRALDPPLLTTDDGIVDFSFRNGAMNKGGVSEKGEILVHPLASGRIDMGKEMMDDERALIGDVFLTTIFQTLVENPQMTATQVIELINQKGIFLAPTVGGMASDYLDPTISRELDLAMQFGILDPMPPLLKEAKGEYKVTYTSPLFKAARAGEASGFLRTMESALQVAGQMNDPTILDWADHDVAWPEIARIQDVPESWMASPEKIAAKRKARSDAAQQQQQVQAMPAQAAMMKAQATVAKLGGKPQVPGQQPGPQQ
jgi:hypothetical protein